MKVRVQPIPSHLNRGDFILRLSARIMIHARRVTWQLRRRDASCRCMSLGISLLQFANAPDVCVDTERAVPHGSPQRQIRRASCEHDF
jgi:hypothetical protein